MSFNFDEQIERKNTDSIKFDNVKGRGKSEDLLPLWVADMDFRAPDEVINALVERTQHGIFGYSEPNDAYYDALGKWFLTRLGWGIERSWVVMAPGVVYAINTAIRAFTSKGDAVLIQQPVYYPFASSIENNERRLVSNDIPLILRILKEKSLTTKSSYLSFAVRIILWVECGRKMSL